MAARLIIFLMGFYGSNFKLFRNCPVMENVESNALALKILVDYSGSMSGISIEQAKKGLQKIVTLLSPRDRISYRCFGNDVRHGDKAMLVGQAPGCAIIGMKRNAPVIFPGAYSYPRVIGPDTCCKLAARAFCHKSYRFSSAGNHPAMRTPLKSFSRKSRSFHTGRHLLPPAWRRHPYGSPVALAQSSLSLRPRLMKIWNGKT